MEDDLEIGTFRNINGLDNDDERDILTAESVGRCSSQLTPL